MDGDSVFPGPRYDIATATQFIRTIGAPHRDQPKKVALRAINGRAPQGDPKFSGDRVRDLSISLESKEAFEAGLRAIGPWFGQLAEGNRRRPDRFAWAAYYCSRAVPIGVRGLSKDEIGPDAPALAAWGDCDNGKYTSETIVDAFCGALGIAPWCATVIRTGTLPHERCQIVLHGDLPPDTYERLFNTAIKLGLDDAVYDATRLLRLPGSIAQPWKGGVFKEGRVAEPVIVTQWGAAPIRAEWLRIPTQSGRGFRFEAGHRSDLIPATIPN